MMILKWDFVLDLHLNKNIFYGELIILVKLTKVLISCFNEILSLFIINIKCYVYME